MAASDILSLLLGPSANSVPQQLVDANQEVMAQMYDSVAPFSLGTHTTQENKKRTRKEILTKWEQMVMWPILATLLTTAIHHKQVIKLQQAQ